MHRASRPQKLSWALYDLANTIFSMNVISLYFPLWIASTFKRGDVWYAVAYSTSMFVIAVLSPLAGALGQRIGQKLILLIATIIAVGCTGLLGTGSGLVPILLIFCFANIAYQTGLVAYNALLPSVAELEERGRISGLGVALGYIGSFVGMFAALKFTSAEEAAKLPDALRRVVDFLVVTPLSLPGIHRENVFIPTAILFAIFAIPLFLFVRERKLVETQQNLLAAVGQTFREIIADRNLLKFYLATFFYMDAVHTTYIVMATYGKFAAGLNDSQIVKVMSIAIITAVLGSFAYGWITDRVTTRTALLIVILNWVVALSIAIPARGFAHFLVVAIVAGVGLGGVEVVGRVALLAMVGEEASGRYFGFFNLMGKASSIVGPQLWALCLLVFEPFGTLRFRFAVMLLLAMTIVALLLIRTIRFEKPALAARDSGLA